MLTMTKPITNRPLVRIDVPNLIMKLGEYSTPELQEYYKVFLNCIEMLNKRRRDRRLIRKARQKARDKLRGARKLKNRIRAVLLARGAELEPSEEWDD